MADVCLKIVLGGRCNPINNSGGSAISVIDNLLSTSITSALSANQGRVLAGLIADIVSGGEFLSKDEILATGSEVEPSNDNVMSALRTLLEITTRLAALEDSFLNRFLSKIEPDTAAGLIEFVQGLEIGEYTSGLLGGGGAFKMIDGISHLEVDKLDVRMLATFFELIISRAQHIGGQLVLSPARMKCVRVEEKPNSYRCYFNKDEDKVVNEFVVDDQARCQVFEGSGAKFYWRLVTAVGDDWIELSKTDKLGDSIPEAGDDIIQLGNRSDATRQSAQILSTVGFDAPSYKQYGGINSFSLEGKELTVFSRLGNKIVGAVEFTAGSSGAENIPGWTELVNKTESKALELVLSPGALVIPVERGTFTMKDASKAKVSAAAYLYGIQQTIGQNELSFSNATGCRVSKDSASVIKVDSLSADYGYFDVSWTKDSKTVVQRIVFGTIEDGTDGKDGKDGLPGKDGLSISDTIIEYAKSSSGTVKPSSGWGSQPPTPTKGWYLWTRTTWTYTDSSTEIGYSNSYWATDGASGNDGIAGKDGVGIVSTAITYAQSTSGTVAPSSGWTSQPPVAIAGRYIWTKTVWTYSNETTETGYSVGKIGDDGVKGDDGYNSALLVLQKRGISPVSKPTTALLYMFSTGVLSGAGLNGWTLGTPPAGNDPIWTIHYLARSKSDFVSINTGQWTEPKLYVKDGADGVSVVSITPLYRMHYMKPTVNSSETGWSEQIPPYDKDQRLWQCERVLYSDGSKTYTAVIENQGWIALLALNYLTEAFEGDTEITGGIVATNLILMRNALDEVVGGLSGVTDDPTGLWLGGTYAEALAKTSNILINKSDGSGHLAKGNLSWDANGNLSINGMFGAKFKNIVSGSEHDIQEERLLSNVVVTDSMSLGDVDLYLPSASLSNGIRVTILNMSGSGSGVNRTVKLRARSGLVSNSISGGYPNNSPYEIPDKTLVELMCLPDNRWLIVNTKTF